MLACFSTALQQNWTRNSAAGSSDVNKDWTCKDKDKDQAYKDKDKD